MNTNDKETYIAVNLGDSEVISYGSSITELRANLLNDGYDGHVYPVYTRTAIKLKVQGVRQIVDA